MTPYSHNVLSILLLTIIATIIAPVTFAQEKYPVKLRFEHISQQAVSELLNDQSVPNIIVSSWDKANKKYLVTPPSGEIAKYDLNDDGIAEVFLYLSGHGLCGSGGCHLVIFQFNEKSKRLAYKTTRSSSNDILILGSMTHGYHNLAIRLMDGISKTRAEAYTLYQWKNANLEQTDETILFHPARKHCD